MVSLRHAWEFVKSELNVNVFTLKFYSPDGNGKQRLVHKGHYDVWHLGLFFREMSKQEKPDKDWYVKGHYDIWVCVRICTNAF